MEDNKLDMDVLEKLRLEEEEMLSKMSEEEQAKYMKKKTEEGLEIAKKLGLKVGD